MSGSDPSNENKMDFDSFYRFVCNDLQKCDILTSTSKSFSTCQNDEERIQFLLETNYSEELVSKWKDYNFSGKDRGEATRLRNSGNRVYQSNKLVEALSLYSASICIAPHGPPPSPLPYFHGASSSIENPPEDSAHQELALGYANRSAVLFQMKEYELCIRDITRAFDNSYPNNLMYKLFERKARCLKAIKDFPRALESMKNAEMWMKYSTLSETKSSSFKKEIIKQITFLEEKVSGMSVFSDGVNHKKGLSAPVKLLRLPELKGIPNREIPAMTHQLSLRYNSERGRHFVATENIMPGDVLMAETPYSAILLPEHYETHCQSCFYRIIAPIPCWRCSKVRFCSDNCRNEAWERFHKIECEQLNLILESNVGKNALLALRILTSSGKIYLEYVINICREENESRLANSQESYYKYLGFNEQNVYDSADYRTIYSLVTNTERRDIGDLFKRSLMALYLLKILEKTLFFYNGGSELSNVQKEDKIKMGSLLLRHLQNLPCNAHEISEMESSSYQESTEIGAAVYGAHSLLNHSCDPNVVRHNYSSDSAVRAIRPIRKNEEILDNYGYHYAVMSKKERQNHLSTQYYFDCNCTPCSESWPLYSHLPSHPTFLPSIDSNTISQFHKSSKAFKKVFDTLLNSENRSVSLSMLVEHLSLLDTIIDKPYKEINDCQETMKQILALEANSFIQIKD